MRATVRKVFANAIGPPLSDAPLLNELVKWAELKATVILRGCRSEHPRPHGGGFLRAASVLTIRVRSNSPVRIRSFDDEDRHGATSGRKGEPQVLAYGGDDGSRLGLTPLFVGLG